jgi:hypothetical protein
MSRRAVKFVIAFSLCLTAYDLFALGRYGFGDAWALVSLGAGVIALTCGFTALRMRARKDVRP